MRESVNYSYPTVAVSSFEKSLPAPLFASPMLTFPGAAVGEGAVLKENPPAPPPTEVVVGETMVFVEGELEAILEADEAGAGELRVIVIGAGTEALEDTGWGTAGMLEATMVAETGADERAGRPVDAPQPTVTVETTVTVRRPSGPRTTAVGSTRVMEVVEADPAVTVTVATGATTVLVGGTEGMAVVVIDGTTVFAGGLGEAVTLGWTTEVAAPVETGKVTPVNWRLLSLIVIAAEGSALAEEDGLAGELRRIVVPAETEEDAAVVDAGAIVGVTVTVTVSLAGVEVAGSFVDSGDSSSPWPSQS